MSNFVIMLNQLQNLLQNLPNLLIPKPVRIEVPLDKQLSDAIATAVHNPEFRAKLLDRPKSALASLDIHLPIEQQVTVLESTSEQTFLVMPMMTDREVEILQAGLDSGRALRAIRSQVILKAWQDPDYKIQLLTHPKVVLIAAGFQISDRTTISVLENDAQHLYLVIPSLH